MSSRSPTPTLGALETFIRKFEAARSTDVAAEWHRFLPSTDHPEYLHVVRELVRIDLEYGWNSGTPRPLDDYVRTLPEAFERQSVLRDVAFEEYRQRRDHGNPSTAADYAKRYNIPTDDWPDDARTVAIAGRALKNLGKHSEGTEHVDSQSAHDAAEDAADLIRSVQRENPAVAYRLAAIVKALPEAGAEIFGFELIEELGRGAFGRVFLARQRDLADRLVALKFAADLEFEPQTIARLQHTNIVPIHSIHGNADFQAACMPYLGRTTLIDVLRTVRSRVSIPTDGEFFIDTIRRRQVGHAAALPNAADIHLLNGTFAGRTYVDAVLNMIARLADGLSHAHARGIIHRDLKPGNILLTDDGRAMLLDFNLSYDQHLAKHPAGARIGGTLPYMSPEQIEAFGGKKGVIDWRSDVYSLGLIAWELLAGRPPFQFPNGVMRTALIRTFEDRCKGPPPLRPANPAVSRAAEAIVLRALHPNVKYRYQSAQSLREDIERHLRHEPLRHVREPSSRERIAKWSRRHPRLSSSTTVAVLAALLIAGLTMAGLSYTRNRERAHARLAAHQQLGAVSGAKHEQQALLFAPDRTTAGRITERARATLSERQIFDDPNWPESAERFFDASERERFRGDVAELLIGWADAETKLFDDDQKRERLELAWRLNERAGEFLRAESRSVLAQRSRLAERLQRPEAAALSAKAKAMGPATAADHFAAAREWLQKQEVRRAVPHLLEATRLDPRHFWARHFLGNCYYEQLQYSEAIASYSDCIGLAPEPAVAYFPHYHRALVYLAQGRLDLAEADLAQAVQGLQFLPGSVLPLERARSMIQLAKLHEARSEFAAAERSLSDALESGTLESQLLLERARIREKKGDATGAESDRAQATKVEPTTALEWNWRGLARLDRDPKAALADFQYALQIEPDFHPALQNMAHVLSEHLNRPDDALAVLDQLVKAYPGYVTARIGRGVLLARNGKREAAVDDVRESLARDRTAATLYQAANVFALTSRQHPEDFERVLPLLGAALWSGFGLDVIDKDADMDAVRNRPAFQQLIRIVRELNQDLRHDSTRPKSP